MLPTRRQIARSAAAIVVIASAAALAASAQQFRTGVDLVRLPVVVTGRDGLLVRGLVAGDFQVFEDGQPQAIAAFVEGAPGEAVPLHLGLMLDRSGSMDRDIRDAVNAAVQFVTALDEAVDTTLVDFDTTVRVGRFAPPSYPHLFERLRSQKAEGYTALYDAVASYLRNAAARDGQHVLILYTDGQDSRSQLRLDQLVTMLRSGNVMIYSIGYLENQVSSDRVRGQMTLTTLARETGGDAFFPSSPRELHKFYARILDELGSRYTLGYVSTNTKADGKFRKVQVRLKPEGLKSVKVRTRTGYQPLR